MRKTHIQLDPIEYADGVLAQLERDPGDYVGQHRRHGCERLCRFVPRGDYFWLTPHGSMS